jgi:cyclin-dependent kinase regulatory subunit CKS1
MSKYQQKPYSAEEKQKAIQAFAEKITYSARYSSE